MRSPRTATKSSPCSPQLEKAHAQQQRCSQKQILKIKKRKQALWLNSCCDLGAGGGKAPRGRVVLGLASDLARLRRGCSRLPCGPPGFGTRRSSGCVGSRRRWRGGWRSWLDSGSGGRHGGWQRRTDPAGWGGSSEARAGGSLGGRWGPYPPSGAFLSLLSLGPSWETISFHQSSVFSTQLPSLLFPRGVFGLCPGPG